MEWVTTSTIVHDLRDHANDAAWRGFVDRFRAPVVRFVMKMGLHEAEAEDVAQETLTAFALSLRDGRYDRERGKLRSWLFGIAYKKALRQMENDRRRGKMIEGTEAERAVASFPDEKSASDLWNTHWDHFLVRECMRQVRREFRPQSVRAFELVVREDYTAEEAARELGVAVKSVYNAKHRVVMRLRELRKDLEEM